MNHLKIGKLIKEFRTRKKISQEELCGNVCAISTLSRIERGEIVPTQNLIRYFCEKLDLPESLYIGDEYKSDYNRDLLEKKILSQINAGEFNIEHYLFEYENQESPMDKFQKQFFDFSHILFSCNLNRKSENILHELIKTLEITIPHFSFDIFSNYETFSELEIMILNAICGITFQNNPDQALSLLLEIKKYYESNKTSDFRKSSQYSIILSNLCFFYINIFPVNWSKVYDIANKGKEHCINVETLNMLPEFVYNISLAEYNLGMVLESEKSSDAAALLQNFVSKNKNQSLSNKSFIPMILN